MAKKELDFWNVYLSKEAMEDRKQTFDRGIESWSDEMAIDYDSLIGQALHDLGDNPHRIGSKKVRNREDDLYQYKIALSKNNIDVNIKSPKHLIFYYTIEENIVAVSRILKDGWEQQKSNINLKDTIQDIKKHEDEYGDIDLDKLGESSPKTKELDDENER